MDNQPMEHDDSSTERYWSSSSNDTQPYYQEALWGPVRLYTEAKMEDTAACINWCIQQRLVRPAKDCSHHRSPMSLAGLGSDSRNPYWYCGKCNKRISVYKDSIFEDLHMPLQKILMLGYSFANESTYEEARRNCTFSSADIPITNRTIAHWFDLFREIVADHCLDQAAMGSKIGGPGHIVQVDEAMIGRRKFNRGRLVKGTWIFGMVDDEGEIRLEIVATRDVQTLTEVIVRNVARGSIIHSDSWRGYSTRLLEEAGFTHSQVNHSVEFVAADGTHTQRIESQWRVLKQVFRPGGIRKEDIADHLLEYSWRRKCRACKVEPFNDLIKLARVLNP